MTRIYASIGLTLDGYMAPEGMDLAHFDDPSHRNWGEKWGRLMGWMFEFEHFRRNLKLGEGGETGPENDLLREATERAGAHIMGRRMFDGGERAWPEEAPFHTPVFVLTHHPRESWARPGGTTFHFVSGGPVHALELARQAAGDKDIRISGGADVIQQFLALGLLDELQIALAPVLFGGGRRLFEHLGASLPDFRVDRVHHGREVVHLTLTKRPASTGLQRNMQGTGPGMERVKGIEPSS